MMIIMISSLPLMCVSNYVSVLSTPMSLIRMYSLKCHLYLIMLVGIASTVCPSRAIWRGGTCADPETFVKGGGLTSTGFFS